MYIRLAMYTSLQLAYYTEVCTDN